MTNTFRLYDTYEEKELLGHFDTTHEVANACCEREEETDNECCFCLYQKCIIDNKYHIVRNWTYNKNNLIINT